SSQHRDGSCCPTTGATESKIKHRLARALEHVLRLDRAQRVRLSMLVLFVGVNLLLLMRVQTSQISPRQCDYTRTGNGNAWCFGGFSPSLGATTTNRESVACRLGRFVGIRFGFSCNEADRFYQHAEYRSVSRVAD